jgi:hypothetical protein
MPLSPSRIISRKFDCLQEHRMFAPRLASRIQVLQFRAAISGPVGNLAPLFTVAGEIAGWALYERKQQKPLGCHSGQQRCGERCIPLTHCCADNECADCESCRAGICLSRR